MDDPKDIQRGEDDARDILIINAFTSAIRERGVDESLKTDLASFYRAHGVDGETLELMLERGPRRLRMYRQMVQGRLRRVLRELLPRTVARLGKKRLYADFADFFDNAGSHTVILREVPAEFTSFCRERWAEAEAVPDFLSDLASHELLSLEVRNSLGGREPATGLPLALDRPLRFDGTCRLRRYDYAVHSLPLDVDDRSEPEAIPSALLAYRDREYAVRFIALTQRATEVLERLLAGSTVVSALQEGAIAAGETLGDEFLAGMTHLFADLSERGVLLGALPDTSMIEADEAVSRADG